MRNTHPNFGATARGLLCAFLVSIAILPVALRAAADRKPTQMEKFVVNEKHLLCFGLAITLWEDKNTGLVQAMYVKDVGPDSVAHEKGLRPGTRIWTIDNIPADSFEATFAAGSPLGEKFLNRKGGDKILLEVTLLGERQTRVVVLEQSPLKVEMNVKTVNTAPQADWNWSPSKKTPEGDSMGARPPPPTPPEPK